MKRLFLLTLIILAFLATANAQFYTRTNRIYRPCAGAGSATSFARVSIDSMDSITLQPCPDRVPLATPPYPTVQINTGDGDALATFSSFSGVSFSSLPVYMNSNLIVSSDLGVGYGTPDDGSFYFNRTLTDVGTTGNVTINKIAGTVNIAAGAGTAGVTVTNSTVTANSIVIAIARTNDATCSVKNAVPAAGSFVLRTTANCTAETSFGFIVTN